MDPDPRVTAFGFVIILAFALYSVAVLIQKKARAGTVLVVLLLPFVYLVGMRLVNGGIPQELDNFSHGLVVGVISSLIGGLILYGVTRK